MYLKSDGSKRKCVLHDVNLSLSSSICTDKKFSSPRMKSSPRRHDHSIDILDDCHIIDKDDGRVGFTGQYCITMSKCVNNIL